MYFTLIFVVLILILYGGRKKENKSLKKATLVFAYMSLVEIILLLVYYFFCLVVVNIGFTKNNKLIWVNPRTFNVFMIVLFALLVYLTTIPVVFIRTNQEPTLKSKKYLVSNSFIIISIIVLFSILIIGATTMFRFQINTSIFWNRILLHPRYLKSREKKGKNKKS